MVSEKLHHFAGWASDARCCSGVRLQSSDRRVRPVAASILEPRGSTPRACLHPAILRHWLLAAPRWGILATARNMAHLLTVYVTTAKIHTQDCVVYRSKRVTLIPAT